MILLAGVAPGLVDGVTAQTTPTGRAISMMPRSGYSAITPTDLAPCRSRSRPSVLRWFLRILSSTLPMPVSAHRQLGQLAVARRLHDGPAGGGDELVDARLVVAVGDALRGAGARDERVTSAMSSARLHALRPAATADPAAAGRRPARWRAAAEAASGSLNPP